MKKLVLTVVLLISGISANGARADRTFDGLCIFGDSLSSNVYYGGGAGQNWPYFLRPVILSAGAFYDNQAAGGLRSDEILGRINRYVGSNPVLNPEALYAVYGGINDYGTRAGNIVSGVNVLAGAGAGYILVSNLHHNTHHSDAVIDGFNKNLRSGLGGTGANVIMADNCSLINELSADPSAYGFGADPVLTDGLHFSDRTGSIVAQYFNSVIQAPVQISVLPEFPGYAALLNNARLDSIVNNDLLDAPVAAQYAEDHRESAFFVDAGVDLMDVPSRDDSVSADMTDLDLILGGYFQMIEDVKTGLALNVAYGDGKFGEGKGDFSLLGGIISLFAEFEIDETVPVTLMLSQGFYEFDEINRSVDLGSAARKCSGSTSASTTSLAARGRYLFQEEENSHFGTCLGLDYVMAEVDGYSESGHESTSMKFGSQDVDKTAASLGLFYDYLHEYDWATVRYLVRGDYLYTLGGGSRTLSARVKSFDNSFRMPAYSPGDYSAFRLSLGADFILYSGFSWNCSYGLLYSEVSLINSFRAGIRF